MFPCGGGGTSINFKIKFQGVTQERPSQIVTITLSPSFGEGPTKSYEVRVVSDENGIYSGSFIPTVAGFAPQTAIITVKGPVHLSKTFNESQIQVFTNGSNSTFDWSNIKLLAGDVITTGESYNFVNALDIGKVIEDYFPNSPASSPADLNFDGRVNALDIGMVIEMYFKHGE